MVPNEIKKRAFSYKQSIKTALRLHIDTKKRKQTGYFRFFLLSVFESVLQGYRTVEHQVFR